MAGLKFLLLLTSVNMILVYVEGKTNIRIKFVYFKNQMCCDCIIFHSNDCDHMFDICVDRSYGNNDVGSCAYTSKTTDHYHDMNEHYFGNTLSVSASTDDYQGCVKLKVRVTDKDTLINDHVVTMYSTLCATPSANGVVPKASAETISKSNTILKFEYTVWCAQYYYGSRCKKRCRPDELGHYSCSATGDKICSKGWEGTNCDIWSDDCYSSPCMNGGSCVDGQRAFSCACANGYTGRLCETDIDECRSAPCQNGGLCIDTVAGYSCACAPGYTSQNCETNIDECQSSPCRNGGLCDDKQDGYLCQCRNGFVGSNCELHVCNKTNGVHCHNNGSCYDDGKCLCRGNFGGSRCGADLCSNVTCGNGGTCVRGNCSCAIGFAGSLCQIDIDECSSAPCVNGTCRDFVGGYSCNCSFGFHGRNCERYDHCSSTPCQNGGNCTGSLNAFRCECRNGYYGKICEQKVTTTTTTTTTTMMSFSDPGNWKHEPGESVTHMHGKTDANVAAARAKGDDNDGVVIGSSTTVAVVVVALIAGIVIGFVIRRKKKKVPTATLC